MARKSCSNIKRILKVERAIIEDHIDKHKWCKRIKDSDEAIIDFVQEFAWLMREIYCGAVCLDRDNCEASSELRRAFLDDISDGEIREYIKCSFDDKDENLLRVKLHVIKHGISTYKWLNKIGTYEDAVKDFLQKFGWLIFEVYKKSKKEESNGNRR